MFNESKTHPDGALIDSAFDRPGDAAEFFGVTVQAIYQWRGSGLPRARRRHLQSIRPDLFPAAEMDAPLPANEPSSARPAA